MAIMADERLWGRRCPRCGLRMFYDPGSVCNACAEEVGKSVDLGGLGLLNHPGWLVAFKQMAGGYLFAQRRLQGGSQGPGGEKEGGEE